MMEESNIFQNPEPDNFIITNKSCIEKKKTLTEEEQDQKDLHILHQISNQNFPLSKIRKDLNAFVENTQTTIKFFASPILNLQEKIDINNVTNNSLYKNKVASFNRSLNSFKDKMNLIV